MFHAEHYIKHKKGSSLQRKNIVHIDANAETAIKPAFLGFMAVYSSSKCQRRDYITEVEKQNRFYEKNCAKSLYIYDRRMYIDNSGL